MGNLWSSRNRNSVSYSSQEHKNKLTITKTGRVIYDELLPVVAFQATIKKMLNIQIDDSIAPIVNFIGFPNEIEFSCDITFSANKRMPSIGKFAIASIREYYEFPIELHHHYHRNNKKLLVEFEPQSSSSSSIKKVSL